MMGPPARSTITRTCGRNHAGLPIRLANFLQLLFQRRAWLCASSTFHVQNRESKVKGKEYTRTNSPRQAREKNSSTLFTTEARSTRRCTEDPHASGKSPCSPCLLYYEALAGLERIFRRRSFSAVVGENVAPASSRQAAVDAKRSCPASHAGETPALRFFLTSCTSAVRSLVAAEGRRFENTPFGDR